MHPDRIRCFSKSYGYTPTQAHFGLTTAPSTGRHRFHSLDKRLRTRWRRMEANSTGIQRRHYLPPQEERCDSRNAGCAMGGAKMRHRCAIARTV
jgi:hypothetical protein